MIGTEQAWSRGWRTARQRCYGRRDKWKTIEVSYDVGENHMGGEGGREVRELHPDPVWIEEEVLLEKGGGAFCGGVGSDHSAVKIARITLGLQRQKRPEKGIIIRTR